MRNFKLCVFILTMVTSAFFKTQAQTIKKTIGNYSSELQTSEVKAKSYATRIYFTPGTGLLVIEDRLTGLHYNELKQDTLNDTKDEPLTLKFQTTLPSNLAQIFKENKYANLIRCEGTVTVNGINKECVAFYAPVILNPSSGEVFLDFTMKFDLNEFNVNNKKILLNGLTEFEIEDGFVIKAE